MPGFAYELQQFQASGTRFSKSDLIAISIGGNDLSAVASVGAIQADATASAQKAVFGGNVVNGFVTAGVWARNGLLHRSKKHFLFAQALARWSSGSAPVGASPRSISCGPTTSS